MRRPVAKRVALSSGSYVSAGRRRSVWKGGKQVAGMYSVEVDVEKLLDALAERAANNRSRRAVVAGGAVRVILDELLP